MTYPRSVEFGEQGPLDGEKKKLDEILNHEILIISYRLTKSHFKDDNYTTVQYEEGGRHYVIFTGSEVIKDQLERNKEKLPFYATIVKKYKYYSLS